MNYIRYMMLETIKHIGLVIYSWQDINIDISQLV